MKIFAITAMDENRVIGLKGGLPWNLPADLKHMSTLTKGNYVLMGRSTYDSLPEKYRPLPQRKNIVVTKQSNLIFPDEVEVWHDLSGAISYYRNLEDTKILWIFGGQNIYEQTVSIWDEVYLTYVPGKHEGDAYLPKFEDQFELRESTQAENCEFRRYVRV